MKAQASRLHRDTADQIAAVPSIEDGSERELMANDAGTCGPRQGHTPGPWRWEVNRASKSIKLCGGPPNKGFGRYDLTVMEFCRYGMNKAAPVFWDWCSKRFVGTPHRADALAVTVEGREHHASWFADIDHPDARLIAAAPEMLAMLEQIAEGEGPVLHHDLIDLIDRIKGGHPRCHRSHGRCAYSTG